MNSTTLFRLAESGNLASIRGLGKQIERDLNQDSVPRAFYIISSLLAQNNVPLSGDPSGSGSPSATIAEAALLALEEILTLLTTQGVRFHGLILSPILVHWPHIWKWLQFLLHRLIGQYDMDVDPVGEGPRCSPHYTGGLDSLEYRLTNLLHMIGRISTYQFPHDTDACASTPRYLHTIALVRIVNAHRAVQNYPTRVREETHMYRFLLLAHLSQHPIRIMHTGSSLEKERHQVATEFLSFPDTTPLCQQLLEMLYVRMTTRSMKPRSESFQDLLTIYAVVVQLLGNPHKLDVEFLCTPLVLRITSRLLVWYEPKHTIISYDDMNAFCDTLRATVHFLIRFFASKNPRHVSLYCTEVVDSGILVIARRVLVLGQCPCISMHCPWSAVSLAPKVRQVLHYFVSVCLDRIKFYLWLGPPIVYRKLATAAAKAENTDKWIPGQSGNLPLASMFELGNGSGQNWDTFCDFVALAFEARQMFKGAPTIVCENLECPRIYRGNQKKCSACGHAFYCSRECQKACWKNCHQDRCGGLARDVQLYGFTVGRISYHEIFVSFLAKHIEQTNEARKQLGSNLKPVKRINDWCMVTIIGKRDGGNVDIPRNREGPVIIHDIRPKPAIFSLRKDLVNPIA